MVQAVEVVRGEGTKTHWANLFTSPRSRSLLPTKRSTTRTAERVAASASSISSSERKARCLQTCPSISCSGWPAPGRGRVPVLLAAPTPPTAPPPTTESPLPDDDAPTPARAEETAERTEFSASRGDKTPDEDAALEANEEEEEEEEQEEEASESSERADECPPPALFGLENRTAGGSRCSAFAFFLDPRPKKNDAI